MTGMIGEFLGGGNFGKYFFGLIDLSKDFFGYSKQSEDLCCSARISWPHTSVNK